MRMTKKRAEFVEYMMSFYAPNEMYGDFFQNTLKKEEVLAALKIRLTDKKFKFEGDSMDREITRDIIFHLRGQKSTEHNVGHLFA